MNSYEYLMKIRADLVLCRLGWFPWGTDAWINKNDLGTVMSTVDALSQEGLFGA